ncbi:MAG: hypothetical protein DMF89_18780 [Acidobacteria bacterium]|nr:MAG: hypothetical protein DMF90_20975 [Acidobacteriota bacterium]PYR47488.1 MAG: hypothetical protein DMF89_18780 [Acidobacteriota bacterium]
MRPISNISLITCSNTHLAGRRHWCARVYEAPATLLTFPQRGRPRRKEGTREMVLFPLPYLLVYAVRDDVIFIVHEYLLRRNPTCYPALDRIYPAFLGRLMGHIDEGRLQTRPV